MFNNNLFKYYFLLLLYIIYTVYLYNLSANHNFSFNDIYNRCSTVISTYKCNRSDILYNQFEYGFQYNYNLLNSSLCKVCTSYLKHSHYIISNNKILAHRCYSSGKYKEDKKYSYELYKTKEMQEMIYKDQHPQNCSNKKYLIIPYWGAGLGSQIHVMGSYLALAINSKRIAIINQTIISRHFFPLTHCNININLSIVNKSHNVYSNEDIVFPIKISRMEIPYIVFHLLNQSSIAPSFYLHYWRIQASKYIYHLKKETLKKSKILEKKYLKFNKNNIIVKKYPCMNVWIRHGDKEKEMKLIETKNYFTAIELFKRISNINFNIYLSTDDRNVINEFLKTNYNVYYLNYSRSNDNNSDWKKDHIYNIVSDINLSLKCIAFVGTRKSNINRLIDELRSTNEKNSNIPYFEIGRIKRTDAHNNNLEITEFW